MVLGEAAAFTAAGAHALFGYNRENYMYDRKQRQEMEFQVLEWRAAQSELWRDDVREVIGLTEKKMDTYLIVNTLQLGMCVGLYAEGRLEPGTPPWLLHLYMLTLSAAFMYLLMSVWLAMHASVVASCSEVRLLTQFVRLPVPTWQQLEAMRTYAQTVESLEPSQLLRVPFTGRGSRSSPAVENKKADPWGHEMHGDIRGLYELAHQPAELRRHIVLAQRAAKQYQAFDAFARVCMSFGTVQLLNALCYYVLGYVAVQDGAPFPACCVVIILGGIALGLVHLDFSLSMKEQVLARILVGVGPITSAAATFIWAFHQPGAEKLVMGMLPFTYAAHGLWLLFALSTCGLKLQPNGSVLPMKFRAVLYLDVFGWLPKGRLEQQQLEQAEQEADSIMSCRSPRSDRARVLEVSPGRQRQKEREEEKEVRSALSKKEGGRSKSQSSLVDSQETSASPLLATTPQSLAAASPSGAISKKSSLVSSKHATAAPSPSGPETTGPSGEVWDVPNHAFAPSSYAADVAEWDEKEEVEITSGHDQMDPGKAPAKVFRLATTLLIVLWAAGLALPMGVFREFMTKPLTADVFVEEMSHKEGEGGKPVEHPLAEHQPRMRGASVVDRGSKTDLKELPLLPHGEVMQAEWPSHTGFFPRSLSCDPSGDHIVVADDLGVYQGKVELQTYKAPPKEKHSKKKDGKKEDKSDGGILSVLKDHAFTLEEEPSVKDKGEHADEKAVAKATPKPKPRKVLGVDFKRSAPCNALEGQGLQDISVICAGESSEQNCRVVVLHARGKRLAQCPMPLSTHEDEPVQTSGNKTLADSKSLTTWTLSSDWLHGGGSKNHEHVESFAVNSDCMEQDEAAPSREVGCVVVGTSSGRIVQLKGAYQDRSRLVPERSMRQRHRMVQRGTLHVFPSGLVVALRPRTGTLEAFNGALGTRVGTWRLPAGIDWLMICGGGDSLFALGLRDQRHKELHRFPLPEKLKEGPMQTLAEASLAMAGRAQEV